MVYSVGERPINLAFVGDVLLTRRASVFREPDYLALMEILRGADGAFANLETNIRHWNEGAPAAGGLGTFMTTPPALLDDIRWMGFNLLSCANNHASDFGEGGVLATIRHLDDARFVHAGTGANLTEARAPAYLDTEAGRIALIAATAALRTGTHAGAQRGDMQGRPGTNPLRFEKTHVVDQRGFDDLKRIAAGLGYEKEARRSKQYYGSKDQVAEESEALTLVGTRFERGESFAVSTKANAADVEGVVTWVKEARRQADFVIVSIHYHEMSGARRLTAATREEIDEPAEFVPQFARAVIDAGADVVAGHGPHYPLGIEIYRGKPILYSLGNFFFQTETVERLPEDSYNRLGLPATATPADFVDIRTDNGTRGHFGHLAYWESIAVSVGMDRGGLRKLIVHPVELGRGAERAQRGRPILARGETAARILQRLKLMSERSGTDLSVENDCGLLMLG
ncbi:MAG TPA: CapA family protein [Beijerinckiaceae bacterium]|nr:CapA family protein [Beijerinckiaceae bacterium]